MPFTSYRMRRKQGMTARSPRLVVAFLLLVVSPLPNCSAVKMEDFKVRLPLAELGNAALTGHL